LAQARKAAKDQVLKQKQNSSQSPAKTEHQPETPEESLKPVVLENKKQDKDAKHLS